MTAEDKASVFQLSPEAHRKMDEIESIIRNGMEKSLLNAFLAGKAEGAKERAKEILEHFKLAEVEGFIWFKDLKSFCQPQETEGKRD